MFQICKIYQQMINTKKDFKECFYQATTITTITEIKEENRIRQINIFNGLF